MTTDLINIKCRAVVINTLLFVCVKQTKTENILILQVETQQLDQFKEVTVGVDRLYSIPSVTLKHQGTYQCEVYSGQLSFIRVYYYVSGKTADFRRIFGNLN